MRRRRRRRTHERREQSGRRRGAGNLLDCLKEFIEEDLKDCTLPVKQDGWEDQPNERPIEVHEMTMPEPDEDHERIPYILLQLLNGKDERGNDGQMHSIVNVRIVITIYDRDMREGRMNLLYIVQRLRRDLQHKGVIGNCFTLKMPLEYLIYPDEIEWYHLAEMATQWEIPAEERQVPELISEPWPWGDGPHTDAGTVDWMEDGNAF